MTFGMSKEDIEERISSAFTIDEMKEAIQAIFEENNRLIERQMMHFLENYLTEHHYETDDELDDRMQLRFH